MGDLDLIHPELAKRYTRLTEWAEAQDGSIGITSGSRSYALQKYWYGLYLVGQWPALVVNPDIITGQSPWGWMAQGSLHMVQQDRWSHALDIHWSGVTVSQVHAQAYLYGIQFVNSAENWHAQFWDFRSGFFPIIEPEEEDMTLEELMRGIGREGDGLGCVKLIDGKIHMQLDDGQWYTLADTLEFVHRHMKHLDEG